MAMPFQNSSFDEYAPEFKPLFCVKYVTSRIRALKSDIAIIPRALLNNALRSSEINKLVSLHVAYTLFVRARERGPLFSQLKRALSAYQTGIHELSD